MTTSTNTATNSNTEFQDGTIFTYCSLDRFERGHFKYYTLANNYFDETRKFECEIDRYKWCYYNYYDDYWGYSHLYNDPVALMDFIEVVKAEYKWRSEKFEKMKDKIKNLKAENGKLYKENEELKAKHIKSMMFECEKSKLEREIMNKLMIEQSNTILQLKKEIGRLKNRNKRLKAKINDLYNDMME